MIFDLIGIYKARREPRHAAKLAARLAQSQAIERISAPLLIVHMALWAAVLFLTVLSVVLIIAAFASHWSVALLAIPLVVLAGLAVSVSVGLKTGLDRIRALAGRMGDRGIDRAATWGHQDAELRDQVTVPEHVAPRLDDRARPANTDSKATNTNSKAINIDSKAINTDSKESHL